MSIYACVIWIPLLPLISFLLLGLFGRRYVRSLCGYIGVAVMLAATVLSLVVARQYFFADGMVNGTYRQITTFSFPWLQFSKQVFIDMTVLIDPISVMMLVVVSFVSLMVHVFSLGYMKGEKRLATYFAFLGLFTFSMLGLVLAGNLFQLYIFWELVGVSSFLLIGFYFSKPSAASAAKKAFIVTRFADLGFLIGILVMAFYGGSLDIATLITRLSAPGSPQLLSIAGAGFLGVSALTWALSLVFIGGAGKSAMFPLHIWLPDAMEGPTPVSALIHAATMVVAGVYLVARLFPIFSIDHAVMELITWIGAFSAMFAAVIACTQTDIKRVLAYSTISQIGYMMFALGSAKAGGEAGLGYTASMFHLFTHAFFKSLLFLGAGAVIHFVHSNEMADMGGLRKQMPVTHFSFLIACLAIAGIPPFAGFFSKEEILTAAWHSDKMIYAIGLLTAALTAFYMFRLYFSIFWNKTPSTHAAPGEGTFSMKAPLVLLAICTSAVGLIPFGQFIAAHNRSLKNSFDLVFAAPPVLLSMAAILLASRFYKNENLRPARFAAAAGSFYRAAGNKFYLDELYLFITRKIIFQLIGKPAAWFDKHIVDGLINAFGSVAMALSAGIKGLQSGKIQAYALYFFGGIIALAVVFIYVWK